MSYHILGYLIQRTACGHLRREKKEPSKNNESPNFSNQPKTNKLKFFRAYRCICVCVQCIHDNVLPIVNYNRKPESQACASSLNTKSLGSFNICRCTYRAIEHWWTTCFYVRWLPFVDHLVLHLFEYKNLFLFLP